MSEFTPNGRCPLCNTPWDQDARESHYACDHEAGWYRDWLAEATEIIQDLMGNKQQKVNHG